VLLFCPLFCCCFVRQQLRGPRRQICAGLARFLRTASGCGGCGTGDSAAAAAALAHERRPFRRCPRARARGGGGAGCVQGERAGTCGPSRCVLFVVSDRSAVVAGVVAGRACCSNAEHAARTTHGVPQHAVDKGAASGSAFRGRHMLTPPLRPPGQDTALQRRCCGWCRHRNSGV